MKNNRECNRIVSKFFNLITSYTHKSIYYIRIKQLIALFIILVSVIESVVSSDLVTIKQNVAYAGSYAPANYPEEEGISSKASDIRNTQVNTISAKTDTAGERVSNEKSQKDIILSGAADKSGAVKSFEVLDTVEADTQAPAVPANVKATIISGSVIDLEWAPSSDNVGVIGYRIYRNNVEIGTSEEMVYTDSLLTREDYYSYTIRAYDAAGNLSEASISVSVIPDDTSGDAQAPTVPDKEVSDNLPNANNAETVALPDIQAPTAPGNVVAAVSGASIIISWDASMDNVGVTGYDIYRDSILIGSTTGETTYTVMDTEAGTEYNFMVRARDEAGNVSEASEAAFYMILMERPSITGAITGETDVMISWTEVPWAKEYELSVNGEVINVGNVTTYFHTPILPNTLYEYKVRAIDGSDTGDWSDSTSVMTAPGKVCNLTASIIDNTTIELTWDAVEGALTYEIEINGTVVGIVEGTSYTHDGIDTVTVNNYRVRAVAGERKGLWSDSILKAPYVVIPEGTINQNTVWDKSNGYYYVQGNLTVAQGTLLQIVPGTLIKFAPGIEMVVAGSLVAEGTEELPIVFTSEKDPEYGGSGVNDATDCWREITVNDTGELTADYIKVRYGGYYSEEDFATLCELYVQGKLSLNHSEIDASAQQGIRITSGKDIIIQNSFIRGSQYDNIAIIKEQDAGTITIVNNTISNSSASGIGIYGMGGSDFTVTGNLIENNAECPIIIDLSGVRSSVAISGIYDNSSSGNQFTDDVYLYGELITDITLNENRYAFGKITVPDEYIFRILPGTVMLGLGTYGYIDVYGRMTAEGTSEKDIIFSSMKDTEYGGNGIAAAEDYWDGINIESTGEFRGDNIKIKYGGYGFDPGDIIVSSISDDLTYDDIHCALYAQGIVYLNNSEIRSSYQNGIVVIKGNDVTILNSTIHGSKEDNIRIGPVSSGGGASRIGVSDTYVGIITIKDNLIENAASSGVYIYDAGDSILNIENNVIRNNGEYPVKVNLGSIKASEILTELANNTFEENYRSDYIYLEGYVVNDIVIPKNTYVGYGIDVSDTSILTISPGVTLLFLSGGGIDIDGKLNIEGTQENPVTMTSYDDPQYGGSGIMDKSQYWSGISTRLYAELDADYLNLKYARRGIDIGNTDTKLYNSKIINCEYGIQIWRRTISSEPLADIRIKHNSFQDNEWAVFINIARPDEEVNLSDNYWNSAYGPGFGIAVPKDDGFFSEIIMPEINCPGEKIVLMKRSYENSYVVYTPYLGSELLLSKKMSSGEGNYAPTGNYSKQFTDLSVNCLDDVLTFARTYNSQDTDAARILGKGWTFNYEGRITDHEELEGIKLVKLPDGSQETFTLNQDGTFTSSFSRNTLVKQEDGTYLLTMKDQTKYGFNADGYLIWMENREGNRLTINVSSEGKPLSLADYAGRNYTFAYENSLLTRITDNQERTVQYIYMDGFLTKVIDPEGSVTCYTYDSSGYLTEIRDDKNELVETAAYDTTGDSVKVAYIIDKYGNKYTYTYDPENGNTIKTDTAGNTTVQWYDSNYSVTETVDSEGISTTTVYFDDDGVNKYGEISSATDRNGNTTLYERDDRGNIIKIVNPDASYQLFTYDLNNNLTSKREEAGNYTYYIYDATGTYLLKEIRPLNGTDAYSSAEDQGKYAITEYTYYNDSVYDCKGLVMSVTDPEGNITTYTYDSYGNVKTSADAEANITEYAYNPGGQMISTLSPKGELTRYTYDNNGNLKSEISAGGETTLYFYDKMGRLVQQISPNISQTAQSGDVGCRYEYYSSGELKTVTDPEGNTTAYTYDIYGNLQSETEPNGCIYWYEYDTLNRIIAEYVQNSADGPKTLLKSYSYAILSDKKTQKTEKVALNSTETAVTTYIYDYAGRLVRQVNPDGGILITVYNTNGTIYSETDARDKTTYYTYDGLNRLVKQWTPFENNKYSYSAVSYDKNSNKIAEIIGTESVSLWGTPYALLAASYEYDCNNRVITKIDPAGGTTTYQYDADGNIIRKSVSFNEDTSKVTEYVYNHLGKVETISQYVDSDDIYSNTVSSSETVLVTTYIYDANGNVMTMTAPDGTTMDYEYDNLDRPVTQTVQDLDEYGHPALITTSTTYDYAGNVLSTTDANGSTTRNTYNARGLLVKKMDAEGGVTAYDYDNAGRLTMTVAPENYKEDIALTGMNRAVYTYDTMGRVILEQDIYYDKAAGAWRTIHAKAYQYNKNSNLIKELDALGYESGTGSTIADRINTGYGTIHTYNDANLLITTLTPVSRDNGLTYDVSYTYDAAGRKISEINEKGIVLSYEYDHAGRLTKTTVTDTTESTIGQITYDAMGNILTQTDGNGNTTTYTYNRLGLVKTRTTQGDASIPSDTTVYQYDEMGRQAYQKDSQGREVIVNYNHNGQVLTRTERKEDGTQSITVSNAYDRNGNLRFATDANGVITEQEYDGLNRLVRTSLTVGETEQATVYTYDKNGNQLTTTDWLSNVCTKEYDGLNRLVKETDPYGITIEQYEYNNNHVQVKAIDALGNETIYAYDKNNRLISTTDPEGNRTSQTYDNVGNIATKTDGNGNVTGYAYDALNRLIKVTNAKGEATSYTYDINGNMLTKKDGKGNTVTYAYNAANLLQTETDAGGAGESYTYDADGKVKKKTDKNGSIITYAYDIHGNLLTETADGAGSIGDMEYTYTYDANGNMLTMTDGTGTTRRTYDELGRVLTKTVPKIGTVTFIYDMTENAPAGSHRERTTDPKGNITVKEYDKTGRLAKVIAGSDTVTYTYYANGSRKSVTYNDGIREEYTYNANHQIETLINKKADGSILDSYTYTYDGAGNQLTKHEIISGVEKGTTTYTYDELNRLLTVTEQDGRSTAYEYDEAGNRTKEIVVTRNTVSGSPETSVSIYTYDNRNRLTDIATMIDNVLTKTTGYTYDNNGNQLTMTITAASSVATTENTYDVHNQLIRTVTGDGIVINNTYNAEGYRTGKDVGGEKTYYLYENDKVVLEVYENGSQKAWSIYGTNLLVRVADTEEYRYLYNGHADVTALITREGTIAATYYYDAFGNIQESTGNVDNSILYAGYQYDEETGLYYINARMYDPVTARFLQMDTFRGDPKDPLSLNLYTYCANNPIKYIDPSGHIYIIPVPDNSKDYLPFPYPGNWNVHDKGIGEIFSDGLNELFDTLDDVKKVVINISIIITFPVVVKVTNIITAKGTGNTINESRGQQTAGEIISKEKKGAINREFPSQWRDATLDEIDKAAKKGDKSAQKAKKLLNDKRFDKEDNRK